MLTKKQELFALKIVEGMNQADAYRAAYDTKKMANKTIWEKASILADNGKVRARIAELREELSRETIMTAVERLEWLTKIIKSDKETTTDKLRASDQMNKMQGQYVQRIEGDVDTDVTIRIDWMDE